MAMLTSEHRSEAWRRRLFIPNYHIGEAARYAQISPQTVAAWHRIERPTLSKKDRRAALSYMQLIEVAVVAAFRKAGISLQRIRDAREYVRKQLETEYPFAQYRFKHEGKHLLIDYQDVAGEMGRGKHLVADQRGQLEWDEIVGPLLKEFDYEHEGVVIRWHVAGLSSPIIIDPRISFGAPTVRGVPTWVIKGRRDAGESDSDIAEDFGMEKGEVREALKFEGVLPNGGKSGSRLH
jgi:uncharacterized protein (DUF433 family)/DNA-binding transcriptional MerR regulator